jgi:hypothetical protein
MGNAHMRDMMQSQCRAILGCDPDFAGERTHDVRL